MAIGSAQSGSKNVPIAIFMILVMAFAAVSFVILDSPQSDAAYKSNAYGKCGNGVVWDVDEVYGKVTLTISYLGEGSGELNDAQFYDDSFKNKSWTDKFFKHRFSSKLTDSLWWQYRADVQVVVIEEGVTSIGAGDFGYFTALETVVIPSSVQSIGSHAFHGCENLKKINIPSGVKVIDDYAFEECYSVKKIYCGDTLTVVGPNAFPYAFKGESSDDVLCSANLLKGNMFELQDDHYVKVDAEDVPLKKTVTHRWINLDMTVLQLDEDVPVGTTPKFVGPTPLLPFEDSHGVFFKGWKMVVDGNGDVTMLALFGAMDPDGQWPGPTPYGKDLPPWKKFWKEKSIFVPWEPDWDFPWKPLRDPELREAFTEMNESVKQRVSGAVDRFTDFMDTYVISNLPSEKD